MRTVTTDGEFCDKKAACFMTEPLDNPNRRRFPPLIRRAWFALNQAFRRRIAYSGATPDQFTIMRQLIESPAEGLVQGELARLMSSDPNTITSLLNRMEKNGLVRRCPHETDRRAHRVRLLPKGTALYHELREIALKLQGEVILAVPEDRREQFLEDLERIADACVQQASKETLRIPRQP
jgi:DNA-binding MarR family transcriptional regulator